MRRPIPLAIWPLLLAGAATAPVTDGWTPAGTTRGVALAFRDDPQLDAREARATTDLPFPASAIVPVVCDLSQYTTIVPGVTEAAVLEGTPPADYVIYLRYAPRYLVVAARDVVLHVQGASSVPGRYACSWSELEGRTPERAGTVRMPLLRGSWTIEAVGDSQSRVVYQVAARPGGRIPAWLVRRGAVQALPDIIDKVRERLRQTPIVR